MLRELKAGDSVTGAILQLASLFNDVHYEADWGFFWTICFVTEIRDASPVMSWSALWTSGLAVLW